MRDFLLSVVELLGYLLGTVVLAAAGLMAEWTSLSYLAAGNRIFAVWLAVMGGIALYAAYSVGTDKLLPHARNFGADDHSQ